MSATLQLNYNQIKNLVDQLDTNDKEKLAEYLDDETLFKQLKEFQEQNEGISLSLEEITKEVEAVRSEKHKKR